MTNEEIFRTEANKNMIKYYHDGFKQKFKTLYGIVLKSMDLARQDERDMVEEDASNWKKTSETVAAINEKLEKKLQEAQRNVDSLNNECKKYLSENGDLLAIVDIKNKELQEAKAEIERMKEEKSILAHQLKTDYIKEFVSKGGKLSELKSSPSPDAVGKAIEGFNEDEIRDMVVSGYTSKEQRDITITQSDYFRGKYDGIKQALTLLQSAKSDAVEFTIWLHDNIWMKIHGDKYFQPTIDGPIYKTIQELYTIYQSSKDKSSL